MMDSDIKMAHETVLKYATRLLDLQVIEYFI